MQIKSPYLVAALCACLSVTGCNANDKAKESTTSITTESPANEKVGYSLGYMMASENSKAIKDLNLDTFNQGFRDGYAGKDGALTEEQMQQVLLEYQKQRQAEMMKEVEELAKKNKEKGDKYLAENKSKEGVKTTKSGLQYKVIKAGEGASPKASDIVEVNYEGKLIDGTVFDSSYDRGQPVQFPLNQVIPGWTEGVQLMKKGAKYEFFIPANLAYGEAGNPGIEPNSTLIFTVELLGFKSAPAKATK